MGLLLGATPLRPGSRELRAGRAHRADRPQLGAKSGRRLVTVGRAPIAIATRTDARRSHARLDAAERFNCQASGHPLRGCGQCQGRSCLSTAVGKYDMSLRRFVDHGRSRWMGRSLASVGSRQLPVRTASVCAIGAAGKREEARCVGHASCRGASGCVQAPAASMLCCAVRGARPARLSAAPAGQFTPAHLCLRVHAMSAGSCLPIHAYPPMPSAYSPAYGATGMLASAGVPASRSAAWRHQGASGGLRQRVRSTHPVPPPGAGAL